MAESGVKVVRCLGTRTGIGEKVFAEIAGYDGKCMVMGAELADRLVASNKNYEIAQPNKDFVDTDRELAEVVTEAPPKRRTPARRKRKDKTE